MSIKRLFIALFLLLFISNCENSSTLESDLHQNGSWELVRASQANGFYHSIYFINEDHGWVVGDSGIIIYSDDKGKTWTYQKSGTEISLQDVQFINETTGWIVGSNNTLLKTNNGGQNWIIKEIKSDRSTTFMSLYFIDTNTGWIVDNYGGILYTTDSGNTWTAQESHTQWAITSIQFLNKNEGWALNTNKMALHTTNGGKSWNDIQIPSSSDNIPIVCNDIFFINENKGWICGMYAGSTLQTTVPLYHSKDSGVNWNIQANIPSSFLTSIYFIDEKIGWITGNGKIFNTVDGGRSWEIQHQDESEIFHEVCFVDSIHGWALGFTGNIYKYNIQ
jgi:photosystem II stability/assembly factor-like uncharacterized protein